MSCRDSALKQARALAAETIIKGLNRRGMTGEYCESSEGALTAVSRFLTPGSSVSWGRSATLYESGIIDLIYRSDCMIYDRFKEQGDEEKSRQLFRDSLFCDIFFLSVNAITMDGILVNIDGHGGRIAYLAFGPKKVIVVTGMNKVEPDLESAVKRARNIAAPANACRTEAHTPCTITGKCANCQVEECICSQVLITRRSRVKDRIHVILVGENLGF